MLIRRGNIANACTCIYILKTIHIRIYAYLSCGNFESECDKELKEPITSSHLQVAEYIDLLQLDVARNKKYRMDAEVFGARVMPGDTF